MHCVELLLGIYRPIVLGLDQLEQRDDARSLRDMHYPAIAVHVLQHLKPHGGQTLLHDVHEFQQHQMAKATKPAIHLLRGVHDQLP